jgi:hypothetical protein
MNRTHRPGLLRRKLTGVREAHRRTSLEWRLRMEAPPELSPGHRP